MHAVATTRRASPEGNLLTALVEVGMVLHKR